MRKSSSQLNKGFALLLAWALAFWPIPAAAQNTITNGTSTDPVIIPGFLFEPEFPLSSLKTVPIWNELEQLLDNPYAVALCSSLPPSASNTALVRNTPGTTQFPGSPPSPIYPAYCSNGVVRRPGFGIALPPLLVHPLNYNATTGEEMRLLNPGFPGTGWRVPDELVLTGALPDGTNRWDWTYRNVLVSPGAGRVEETAINYNAPFKPDPGFPGSGSPNSANRACIVSLEASNPPEGDTVCGGDPGEPGYRGFGVLRANVNYSTPAVPIPDTTQASPGLPGTDITGLQVYDPTRGGFISARDPGTGAGGLRKPSLSVPDAGGSPGQPNYWINTDPTNVVPSNENDYVKNRTRAAELGKALFWDMQVGSDTVQSCGSCHAHAGADNRTKNQMNPNTEGGDLVFDVQPVNGDLVAGDFPFQKLANPEIAGDPKCLPAISMTINAGVLENRLPNGGTKVVCDAANVVSDKNNAFGTKVANDAASSMGVKFGKFKDIPTPGPGSFTTSLVKSLVPDLRSDIPAENIDPVPGFAGTDGSGHQFRRVEPRNTPTVFAAALNFDNFWDGRARHDFNGGSVFGPADPQKHVFVAQGGDITATRQIIRFVSLASLATGPALSEFEMSFAGRNWAKLGKKLLQPGVTPLANQRVDPNDSVLGRWSNQPGFTGSGIKCADLPVEDQSASWSDAGVANRPGLCISYPALIQRAFYAPLHRNTTSHLNGAPDPSDPFDGYSLTIASNPAVATDTNQFTQMEANMSLFFGLSFAVWGTLLMPDDTPFDQFLDQNPDMFASIGEVGEPGLVNPLKVCESATERNCFREVGNFKRDNNLDCNNLSAGGEGSTTPLSVQPCRGTRNPGPNAPDPLLGMDIFQGSNFSLKNPNFRAARCGECHAGPTLTDHTVPFTSKAQLGDFIGEFQDFGNEALIEPLGRTRVISGFLLESELGENGQDAVERRIINQSIVPNQVDGLAYPDMTPAGPDGIVGTADDFTGAGQAFFDNGIYNLGVTRCEADQSGVVDGGYCDDLGRGKNDAFGFPMSLSALLLKNLGGMAQEPGVPLSTFTCLSAPCDPVEDATGNGLFEETAQDQQINPGEEGEPANPLLPPYLAPWANAINVGDAMPDIDEVDGGLNTLTDIAMLEGFVDLIGPFNPAGILNESYNNGEGPFMGTWPVVNRVGRFGSFKAPQLREVELTGPYFHNGGKLTLRQVVDFYVRGGDFPITNAEHRDFNIVNLRFEVQSNLTEQEIVSLVDFLLELTDDRVAFERGPFDHPEFFLPLDGTAPENTFGRPGFAARTTGRTCDRLPGSTGPCFQRVPQSGETGIATRLPAFLGLSNQRLVGAAANIGSAACPASGVTSQYCQ
jgi:cytochrome c peroxidase